MKIRGRFDIVIAFDDGAYIRWTSRKERFLTPSEILSKLRECADAIENALQVHPVDAAATAPASVDESPR